MIQNYFEQIKSVTDRFAAMPFVLTAQVSFEVRPGDQGYLVGVMLFTDGSRLHFREFVDVIGSEVDKVMYVYHYQERDAKLVFRYDNALHRPLLAWREHVHRPGDVHPALPPELGDSVLEIVTLRKSV